MKIKRIVATFVLFALMSNIVSVQAVIDLDNQGAATSTPTVSVTESPTFAPEDLVSTEDEKMNGVWISSVVNIDFPSKKGISIEKMKKEIENIVKICSNNGINNIFFQVRPCSDALYKSAIFPWSEYLTGKQGVAPKDGFDPLAFMIETAKAKNIKVHAWLNPYRIMMPGSVKGTKAKALKKLNKNNPARKNPSWVVKHSDGGLYYNPGLPKVQDLVAKGAAEIAENYDVASVHIDDYFYPSKPYGKSHSYFKDAATYKKYKGSFKSKASWRRNNITTLIKKMKTEISKVNPNCQFGVSPAGIWANHENNKLGSKTKGSETYYSHYADTRKWMLENLVDYMIPQVYWEIGNKTANYKTIVKWWNEVAKKSDVKLYIGVPVYRLDKKSSSKVWRKNATIKNQLVLNKTMAEVEGQVYFGYEQIKKNTLKIRNIIKNG